MKLTIDTNADSAEEIKGVINILKACLNKHGVSSDNFNEVSNDFKNSSRVPINNYSKEDRMAKKIAKSQEKKEEFKESNSEDMFNMFKSNEISEKNEPDKISEDESSNDFYNIITY